LGLGIGWRPELTNLIMRRADLGFVEVTAESVPAAVARGDAPLPTPFVLLRDRGVRLVPHGISLGLGGGGRPDRRRIDHLAGLAERFDAPLVSEHVAFVRAGGLEVGHLVPVHRTRDQLDVLVANVQEAQARLPVPLALEPVASVVAWPASRPDSDEGDIDEGAFLTELVERTGVLLLLDLANVLVNCANHGGDPVDLLDGLPLDQIAYVHAAGGAVVAGVHHDTHLHPMWDELDGLLAELSARVRVPGVLLERDGDYPSDAELDAELDRILMAQLAVPVAGEPR